MKKLLKKTDGGVFDNVQGLFVSLAVIVIVSAVMFLVMAQGQDQIVDIQGFNESNVSERTLAYNATVTLTNAAAEVPDWVPLIVLVLIGASIIMAVRMIKR